MRPRVAVVLGAAAAAVLAAVAVSAQRTDVFVESRDHAAIAYSTAPVDNALTKLNARLQHGTLSLDYDNESGYLRSVLDALSIPVESQLLVYAPTSFNAKLINRKNPRAIFFADSVAVAWTRGADVLELAVQDPRQGAIFYTLPQSQTDKPALARNDQCLSCHLSWDTRGVPGFFLQTVFPRRSDEEYANGFFIDHRAPIAERWGGWFVTGARVPRSMGNLELIQPDMPEGGPKPVPAPKALDGLFEPRGYPSLFSDVVALMVLEHQVHAINLITRAGWEHRIGSPHVGVAVEELVDYLLFVDEAPFPHPVKGSSGFAEKFSALGPRDSKGRSLRELDLSTRLMRYPLSYMIYSDGFAGLPPEVRRAVLSRIDDILRGRITHEKYQHLTPATRTAIREILAETL